MSKKAIKQPISYYETVDQLPSNNQQSMVRASVGTDIVFYQGGGSNYSACLEWLHWNIYGLFFHSVVDLSYNKIDDPDVIDVFAEMPNLVSIALLFA